MKLNYFDQIRVLLGVYRNPNKVSYNSNMIKKHIWYNMIKVIADSQKFGDPSNWLLCVANSKTTNWKLASLLLCKGMTFCYLIFFINIYSVVAITKFCCSPSCRICLMQSVLCHLLCLPDGCHASIQEFSLITTNVWTEKLFQVLLFTVLENGLRSTHKVMKCLGKTVALISRDITVA